MAFYNIVFKPSVAKDLRAIPQTLTAQVIKRIENLKTDPLPRQAIKLSGAEHLYRLRVGDYRVVYGIDKQTKQIVVHYIRHRRDVYRDL
jgi:mRNA interferase RelE/StbE